MSADPCHHGPVQGYTLMAAEKKEVRDGMGIPETKRGIEDECSMMLHVFLEDENN